MSGKTGLRRIFIAIDLSAEARSACALHIGVLRRTFPSARIGWERPEKLHITVKFLGQTSSETLAELESRLDEASQSFKPSTVQLNGPGVFPNDSRPRVLWVGVNDADAVVAASHNRVDQVCSTLGYERDGRRYKPHITIGRVRDPHTATDAVTAHLNAHIEPVEFRVNGLVIYESKLLPTGSVYSVVSRFASPQGPLR